LRSSVKRKFGVWREVAFNRPVGNNLENTVFALNLRMSLEKTPLFRVVRPAAWLRVSGEDAAQFLQGQFSQDLGRLEPGRAAYGLWLDHKGKVGGDSFILRAGSAAEGFWVGSVETPAAALRERLEKYIVADDVSVEDETERWRLGLVLVEAPAGDPMNLAHGGGPALASVGGRVFAGRPPALGGSAVQEWVWLCPTAGIEAASRAGMATGKPMGEAEWECARILAGIVAVPRELGPGELPHEGGLADTAVSTTKGCYVGQEIMSRLKTRGRLRRHLQRIRGHGAPPAVGSPIFAGEKRVGEFRSVARGAGIEVGAMAAGPGDFVGVALLPADLPAGLPLGLAPGAATTLERL
jgi:folate-binding protein YgfZ